MAAPWVDHAKVPGTETTGRWFQCYRQAIALFRRLDDGYNQARSLSFIGGTHLAAGDPEAARTCWRQADELFTGLNHPEAESVRAKLDDLG